MAHSAFTARGSAGPTLWTYGSKQYGVWTDLSENVHFTQFDATTKAVEADIDLSTLPGNPLDMPLTPDEHESPSIGITPNGIIYVSAKNRDVTTPPVNLVKITAGADPETVGNWSDASADLPTETGGKWTYLTFCPFAGSLVVLYTIRTVHLAGDPGWGKIARHDGTSWTGLTDIFRGATGTGESFYKNQLYVEGSNSPHPNRGHLFGAWDLTYIGVTPELFSYCYTDDEGFTWRDISGELISTPFDTTTTPATGTDFGGPSSQLYAHGAAIDTDGYPCGIFYKTGTPNQGPHIIRWNGTAWVDDTSIAARYTAGQLQNLVYFRGDLWSFARPWSGSPGDDTMAELRRVAAPNEVVHLASPVGTGWFCHYDRGVLQTSGVIEMLHINNDVPRVVTFGNHAFATAAS